MEIFFDAQLALYHPVAPGIHTAMEQTAQRTILAREAVAAMKRYLFTDQLNQELADNEEAKDAIATVLCDFAQVAWNTNRDLNSAIQAVTWALALNISVEKRKQGWVYEKQMAALYKQHVGLCGRPIVPCWHCIHLLRLLWKMAGCWKN